MTQTQSLPHWQLDSIFPGFDAPAFEEAKAELERGVRALETFMDASNIHKQENAKVDEAAVKTFDSLVGKLNHLYTNLSDVRVFIYGFVSTNAFNEKAQAELSSLQPLSSKLGFLATRATAWVGGFEAEALIGASGTARAHAHWVRRSKVDAAHLMGDEAEELLSGLNPSAGGAWGKLHGDLISRHSVRAALPGRDETDYTVAELKTLQSDADAEVRKAAYEAELRLLERDAVSYAAALNSIKGQVNEVSTRRGWASALDEALFGNAITKASLEAMQTACTDAFPVFRRYLKAKAKFLGKESLAWYDLQAPVNAGEETRYGWDEAKAFVVKNFRSYSDDLSDFARMTFERGWFDVPPRKGKRNGAFCMGAPGVQESRVMLNFGGTLDDIFTVAHELGHAYHNACKYAFDRTLLQGSTPMTLAETASIFCETIVVNAMLEGADDAAKLAVLEQDLLGATQLVVDIHSRFLFEKTVFDKRKARELSVDELKGMMLDAQAQTYGEALDADTRHPYMWAQKGHYYSAGRSYYNFPYTFGYLFGLGLYATYQAEPKGFRARYDELLASTGMSDAASLAKGFGIDIEDPEFWRSSLKIAEARVETFERLVEARV